MELYPWVMRGLLDLPWWGLVLTALVLTHITIAAVTIYLHRHQAHRALDLHPIVSHFFRFWIWLTTAMITKEWVAVHRKHHARVESARDPHSPQVLGISRVLWGGVFLYTKEAANTDTLERFGHGTPDDWIERNAYSGHNMRGVVLMAFLDVALFGPLPGGLIFVVQMLWIPFWAAGVINGLGHFWGYRNFECEDASRNLFPLGILIGGEELHNNHHAFASSAKLSNKWYEFDIGWLYIRTLQILRLAQVKKLAPPARLTMAKAHLDEQTVQAVITHRYELLAVYAKSIKSLYVDELSKLQRLSPPDAATLAGLKRWVTRDHRSAPEVTRAALDNALSKSVALTFAYGMRRELVALWKQSSATTEQLVGHLEDWCRRAEASGIRVLIEFSQRLRSYS